MENQKSGPRMMMLNVLFAAVVVALLSTSLALTVGHTNQGPVSNGGYSPFQTGSGDYTLTIKEMGLPAGHLWNVSLGGEGSNGYVAVNKSSDSAVIQFALANGNYSFTPASAGYASNVTMTTPNQTPDSVTVSGSNLTYNVFFNKTYAVTLIENGLPSGKEWMSDLTDLSYNDVNSSNFTSSNTTIFELVNGTWLASAVPFSSGYSGYHAYFNNSDQSYQYVNINGAPMTVYVQFRWSYNINFKETGLPANSNWKINIANTSMESKGIFNTIYATMANYSVPEFNDTWYYSFSTSVPGGYFAHPSIGSVQVTGHNVSVAVTFSSSTPSGYYFLNFTEVGLTDLSPGTQWYVTLNGSTGSSTTNTVTFSVLNGTYSYIVGNLTGYTSSPSSGTLTVSGSSIVQTVKFSPAVTTPPVWAFVGAYANYGAAFVYKGNTSRGNLTMQVVAVNLSNDTVELRITSQNPFSGVTNNSTEYINWNYFNIWLGRGLISQLNNGTIPMGPNVSVSTSIKVSTPAGIFLTDRVSFSSNGQDSIFYFDMYSGILVAIYQTNTTGSSTANITSTNIPEGSTSLSYYAVTFAETGLSAGSTWYVNLSNGQTFSSTTGTISFSEPNGTYSYTIATSDKTYEPVPSSGSFKVDSSAASESVSFLKLYTVAFTESGLPSGTSWSVTLNGTMETLTTNTITFSLPNGTYSYTIGKISGYNISKSSGSLTINGKNATQSITFSSVPSTTPPPKKSSPPSGISSYELYGIVGGVILVAAIASAFAFTRKRG
ncbi:MAG: hypothetical protein M1477_05330 [Candidatus Thermoplasmatota archaeon]|nr:hypothetical protein [Candidatus Thermoplasmatota archaeon]